LSDLIANGGTLSAAIRLLECVDAEVVECACVIELPGEVWSKSHIWSYDGSAKETQTIMEKIEILKEKE